MKAVNSFFAKLNLGFSLWVCMGGAGEQPYTRLQR